MKRETRDVEKVKRKQTNFNLLLQNQAGQILKKQGHNRELNKGELDLYMEEARHFPSFL